MKKPKNIDTLLTSISIICLAISLIAAHLRIGMLEKKLKQLNISTKVINTNCITWEEK